MKRNHVYRNDDRTFSHAVLPAKTLKCKKHWINTEFDFILQSQLIKNLKVFGRHLLFDELFV